MKKSIDLDRLLRPNIRTITPYSSARSEFSGSANIFLDANENFRDFLSPWDAQKAPRNRYPDPFQRDLKERVAAVFGVTADMLFLGNGSDEAIDLLYRAFAVPGADRAVIMPPTYGVYQVFADVNDIQTIRVPLTDEFTVDLDELEKCISAEPAEHLKLLFVCSPNNPTGNPVDRNELVSMLNLFPGIVVVDEAYQDFSSWPSALGLLPDFDNLVVLRTFSKGWGMAGVRFGMAVSSPGIAEVLRNIKYPYNLSTPAQEEVLRVLEVQDEVRKGIQEITVSREHLAAEIAGLAYVEKVYPSQANFILVRTVDADALYTLLREQGIIIRNRTREPGCAGCVRITVGSAEENAALLSAMKKLEGTV